MPTKKTASGKTRSTTNRATSTAASSTARGTPQTTNAREASRANDTVDRDALLQTLASRFAQFPHRHRGVAWVDVQRALHDAPDKLRSLHAMEHSGGEPDVVQYDPLKGSYVFVDCAPESPHLRRSLCYDAAALASRRENKPAHSAEGLAAEMGVELLTETMYRHLQTLGEFDMKTSSWIATPPAIRALGGALFCDRRYDVVFVYHNGAESYYAARGFRSMLHV